MASASPSHRRSASSIMNFAPSSTPIPWHPWYVSQTSVWWRPQAAGGVQQQACNARYPRHNGNAQSPRCRGEKKWPLPFSGSRASSPPLGPRNFVPPSKWLRTPFRAYGGTSTSH
jgi:hypothetical protein